VTAGVTASSEPPRDQGASARTQIRGSSLLLGGQSFSVLVNLLVQILIVRYLTKSGYGAFAYMLAVVAIAQTVAAFGLRHGIGRFMPIYEERGDLAKAGGALLFSLLTVLSLGVVLAGAVIVLRGVVAGGVDTDDAVTLLTIMIFLAPLFAVGMVLDGAFAVFARPRAIVFRRFLLIPILRLAVAGVMIASGAGVIFLAAGYVVVELVGLAAYAPLLLPALRRRGLLRHMRPGALDLPVRELLGFSAPLLTNDLSAAALNFAGAIIVGALAGAQEVATLRSVFPVVLTMGYVLTSFGILFIPLASRLYARGETAELNHLYWQTASWTTLLAYPIFATSVILAEPVTELLFGDRYSSSAPVLAILAVGLFLNTAAGHNGVVLGVFGRVKFIMLVNAITVATNIGLAFALVPAHGALGAAIAIAIAYMVMNGLRQVGLVRQTTVRAVEPAYVAVLVTAALVTVAGLAVQLALSPPLYLGVVLIGACCTAVFLSVHRYLRLLDTFPELGRLPLLGRLLRAAEGAG